MFNNHYRYSGSHKFPNLEELSDVWGPYRGGVYYCKLCGEAANTWSPGLESNNSICPGATPKEELERLKPELFEYIKNIPGFELLSIRDGYFTINYHFVPGDRSYPTSWKGATVQLRGQNY